MGTTADKLEAEAKRLRRLLEYPNVYIAVTAFHEAQKDEALAAAWRALQEFPCHIDYLHNDDGDYVYDCGEDYCLRCKALNMINALEIGE